MCLCEQDIEISLTVMAMILVLRKDSPFASKLVFSKGMTPQKGTYVDFLLMVKRENDTLRLSESTHSAVL
jgi:hypothetical protein